ncbi:MAG: amidohydrolase family protein [Acidimicrobiia bacterium]|nr:amidohydrolase family protein [Acidimicrobiia bacterium]
MARYDLVIRDGIVIDGTGLARRRGDVGISDGRVVAVGHVPDADDTEATFDAAGRYVAPGIVDAHTHYDPQITFDPFVQSSCFHGVTTVLAGNCGFSLAPTRPSDREYIRAMFARVEGMDPAALEGVEWDFETFPEYLGARQGKLGVNLACFIGHSSLRRFVMGAEGSEREATTDEVDQMAEVLRQAIAAGAAGFSSSHAPTQVDGDGNPIASRFASLDELRTLVEVTGRAGGGSVSYLPKSAVGGLNAEDEELLIELGELSRLPIVIQGLGARSKVDAPGAGWDHAVEFLGEAADRGAAIFSLMRNHPFDRIFDLDGGTQLYDGVFAWRDLMALDAAAKRAALADPARRDELRTAVENPNRDPDAGSTMPPPHFEVLFVEEVAEARNEKWLKRSIADMAAELGVAPADAMLDLALDEGLRTVFRWENKTPEWEESVREAIRHPAIIVGVSDGGAHLDRDDGADWSSYFVRFWSYEQKVFSLEEAVRLMTQVPAALCGFPERGMLLPGYKADIMIFDDTIAPASKRITHDLPGGAARWTALPAGIHATIVNGVPIVVDGQITGALPGEVVRTA